MNQLAFSFQPLARKSDPQTSFDAAENAESFKSRDISKIWNALRDCGPMNYKKIAQVCGMQPVAVARRMAEMERKHLIGYEITGYDNEGKPVYLTQEKCRIARALT